MNDTSTYSVISTGKIRDEFVLADVQANFAKLFKTTTEKASAYVGVKKILKKELELSKAKALKLRLESIGMVIALKEHKPVTATSDSMALSIEEKEPVKADTTMTCPKCDLRQEKADQCSGCGVYVQKLLAPTANDSMIGLSTAIEQPAKPVAEVSKNVEMDNKPAPVSGVSVTATQEEDALSIKGIAAAAVAAVVGALLWKYITILFNYELGIIAWGIGGVVGVTALMFKSKGFATGVICGVFALLSIFAGKYMAMSSLQESWSEDFLTLIEGQEAEYQVYYQQDMAAAQAFSNGVEGKDELVKFLNDHGYKDLYEVDEITDYEITEFNEYVVPNLKKIADSNPTFEEWLQISFGESISEMSTTTLMFADFGIMGFVFLFLGVATAFRMGMGGGS